MRKLLMILMMLTSFAVTAGEQVILNVETQGMPNSEEMLGVLSLVTDDVTGEALEIKVEDLNEASTDFYSLDDLKDGIAMKEMMGVNVITLTGKEIDPTRGGFVDVKYLKSAFKAETEEFSVELGADGWQILKDGIVVKKLIFVVKTNRRGTTATGVEGLVIEE